MKRKKNLPGLIYIITVLLICAAPFLCMTFARTDKTTENRRLAEFPAVTNDGKLNLDILSGLGDYFEDHFAFRNQFVAADGVTQSVFGVSAAQNVIKGTNGWLYYASTAPDYQRQNVLTDRAAFNAANNLKLTQDYVQSKGAAFVLTVAPNKNTLYPENMPYYYPAGTGAKSIDKLTPLLRDMGVNYTDLFALFAEQKETLYLQRDSHWNNKGALLVYNALADAAGKAHDTYANAKVTRVKDEIGDLGRMAYSAAAQPEFNYRYDISAHYTYKTPNEDVEAAYIVTENEAAKGTLLMFRDSFGNTLLPFFAENYAKACFSKATPYLLDLYLGQHAPDTVIVEKVERNVADFAKDPPVFAAPEARLAEPTETAGESTVKIQKTEYDTRFMSVSGEIVTDKDYTGVYAVLNGSVRTAFTVCTDSGDNGYAAYIPSDELTDAANIEIWITANGQVYKTAAVFDTQEET